LGYAKVSRKNSPPHRRLRNIFLDEVLPGDNSLPHRRLRKISLFSRSLKTTPKAVCDRGFVLLLSVLGANIILHKKVLMRVNRYQQDKKRKLCKRRAAIVPIIGHLKSDFRLSRNLLKGQVGDEINVLMEARAMNRSCSYLWVVVLILFGKTKNLFDKF
jgi:hypothetical protein